MTWALATGAVLAALVAWSVYASVRRGRGGSPRRTPGPVDASYEDRERAERERAERLMREQDERERRGR